MYKPMRRQPIPTASFRGLDLFAGLRYVDIDLTVQVDPVNPLFDTATIGTNKSYSDLMVAPKVRQCTDRRVAGIISSGDPAAPPQLTTPAPHGAEDQQQQKAAFGAWEDEGGSTAI
jgi:hypothetical protein